MAIEIAVCSPITLASGLTTLQLTLASSDEICFFKLIEVWESVGAAAAAAAGAAVIVVVSWWTTCGLAPRSDDDGPFTSMFSPSMPGFEASVFKEPLGGHGD